MTRGSSKHEVPRNGQFTRSIRDIKYSGNMNNSSFRSFVTAAPARSSRFEPGKEHGTFAKVRTNLSSTIKYDSNLGSKAAQILAKTRKIESIQEVYPEAYEQAWLMFEKLTFHRENYAKHLPDPIDMVVKCLASGPRFAEEYSDKRKLGRFRMLGMQFVTEPKLNEPFLNMNSYHDSYDVSSFIFWTELCQDYKWMQMGIPDSDQDYLDLITYFAEQYSEKLLTDNMIQETIPDSLLLKSVASNGFNANDPTFKTQPEWSLEYDDPSLDGELPFLICKRSEAPKKPSETRDIGILDPRSMRRHRRFMWPLQRACSRLMSSPHGKDIDHLMSIIEDVRSTSNYYYMRDYAKSGMTLPHKVIRAFMEGFYKRRPEYAKLASEWYEGARVYFFDPGQEANYFHPDTGCPLGLCVEGYTLIQYAIHEINLMSCTSSKGFKFSATNDDMIVGHPDEKLIDEYINIDQGTNSSLGMAFKDTKSGKAENFVYCEEYILNEKVLDKSSLYAQGVLSALLAVNIVQAKDHVYSILLSCPSITEEVLKAVKSVQSHFGIEFTDQETEWPYLFGGWLPQYKNGLDHSIEWFNGDEIAKACYWACREDIHMPKKLDETSHTTIGRTLDITLLEEPKEYHNNLVDLIPIFGTKETLKRHYMRSTISPKAVAREYAGLLKKRLRCFKDMIIDHKREIPDPLERWLERHPNSYIPIYLPGVKFEKVEKSGVFSSGLPENRFLPKLLFMAKKGFISVRGDYGLRPTHLHYMGKGISNAVDHTKLFIPHNGLSSWVLQNLPRGLDQLNSEHGITISHVNPEDIQLKETRLWIYTDVINLVNTKRYVDWLESKGRSLDDYSVMWLADAAVKIFSQKPLDLIPINEEEDEITPELLTYRKQLEEMVQQLVFGVKRHINEIESQDSIEQNFNLQSHRPIWADELEITKQDLEATNSLFDNSDSGSENDLGMQSAFDDLLDFG